MSQPSLYKQHRNLWALAHYFSNGNSKITGRLSNYIKERFLSETFVSTNPSGEQKEENMFVLASPRNGKQAPYFKKEAMKQFIQKHGEELYQKAEEFENECDTVSLRILARKLRIHESQEKKLYQYIENNCLSDTFEKINEDGQVQQMPIFSYPIDSHSKGYLTIQKEGIFSFVKKHKENLELLGAKDLNHIIQNIPEYTPQEGLLLLGDFIDLFAVPLKQKQAFKHFVKTVLTNAQIEETNENGQVQTRPLFEQRIYRQKTVNCFNQENLPYVLKKFGPQLIENGVTPARFDHLTNSETITEKNDEMIRLSTFTRHVLHSAVLIDLTHEIVASHLNDTCKILNEKGKFVEMPVFVKIDSRLNDVNNYAFYNEDTMYAFIKQNKELLSKHGISENRYKNLLLEQDNVVPYGEYIPVSDLNKKLSIIGHDYLPLIPNYLDETFISTDENGRFVEKPLVFRKRENNRGMLRYCILTEAIPHLIQRHHAELNIQKITLEALTHKKPILKRNPEHITLINMLDFLGVTQNMFDKMSHFIKTKCLYDTFTNKETNENEDIFQYVIPKSGKIALMVNAKGLDVFLMNKALELVNLGVPAAHLRQAVAKAQENPEFYKFFVEERRLKQDKRLLQQLTQQNQQTR